MAKKKKGTGTKLAVAAGVIAGLVHLSHGGSIIPAELLSLGSGDLGTHGGWAKAFLAADGMPLTRCNRNAVVAWEYAEGGGFGNQAENNPLNVNPGAGAGWPGYPATGAWAFPDPQTGLNYTVSTIRNGDYQGIQDQLAAGDNAQGVCDAIMASPWASSHYDGNLTASC
jgi:hypothetical protein